MRNKIRYKALLLSLLITFITGLAQARWMTREDSSYEYEFDKANIVINEDGTYDLTRQFKVKILKEPGREYFTNYTLYYNGYSEQVKILEAKTIVEGKEYSVSKDLIEDKPLASLGSGFDQQKQISIAFSRVEIGAEIYLKYKFTSKIPHLKGVFSEELNFGLQGYYEGAQVKICSKLPLHYKVHDPNHVLSVVTDSEDDFHSADIKLTKPFIGAVINEPENSILSHERLTWVSISSLNSWQDLTARYAADYIKVINQDLPSSFKIIAEVAKKKVTDADRINLVTSMLNDKVQYKGDWRTHVGRWIPRDLEKIASTQIGDCKDFSVSTAAILQTLGYKAQVVLVNRGEKAMSPPVGSLPAMYYFNHAMLKVANEEGKIYWIDPTNFSSMIEGIYPDVAGKSVLVLDPAQGELERIPDISPAHSQKIFENVLTVNGDSINDKGKITLKGEAALFITGAALYASPKQIKDWIFYTLSNMHLEENNKKGVTLPDLSSRIVTDLTFNYEYEHPNHTLKTNMGPALTLIPDGSLYDIINVMPNQVSDSFLGIPTSKYKRTIIKNLNIKNIKGLNYEVDTPWIYVKQTGKHNKGDTEIITETVVRKSVISNDELKTDLYKKLKGDIEQNFKDVAVILAE